MRRAATFCLSMCLLCSSTAFAQSVTWFQFDPLVVPSTSTQPLRLEAAVIGNPSRVSFALLTGSVDLHDDGTGGDARAGDGVFTASIPAASVIALMQADDVQRVFVGFLDLYNGATRVFHGNMFVDVYTADIPQVPIEQLAADAQATDHLFNIVDSGVQTDGDARRVAQAFYRYYGDTFDFLNIVSTPSRFANRNHVTVKNDVQGIGAARIDNSAQYGSAGRLLGYSLFPSSNFYDGADTGYSHETAHQWVNFLDFAPYAQGIPHWPVSSMATGVMGFSIGGGGGEGGNFSCNVVDDGTTVTLFGVPSTQSAVFNDFDLYLMGLLPSGAVRRQVVFPGVTSPPACIGLPYTGMVVRVGIDSVLAGAGPRVPDAATSPKHFRAATILVSRDGLVSRETMWLYSWLTSRAELQASAPIHEGLVKAIGNPFFVATDGRASIDTELVATPDFSLKPAQATATVAKGAAATFQISVLPTRASFDQQVTLACGTLASPLACSFSPAQVTPGVTGADVMLTVTTAAAPDALSAAVPLLWLAAATAALRRRRAGLATAAGALAVLTACGGTKPSTPAPPASPPSSATYTIIVTGTSGTMTHTTNLTLTVQ
jgi:hypothetical protein